MRGPAPACLAARLAATLLPSAAHSQWASSGIPLTRWWDGHDDDGRAARTLRSTAV